jgi:SAM-dependent methyltransferase
MKDIHHPEVDVEQLMRRIRQEVARQRAAPAGAVREARAAPNAGAPPALSLLLAEPPRTHSLADAGDGLSLGQLDALHDRPFLVAAYRALLRREPEEDGLRHYLDRLRNGDSHIAILGDIRYSPEGRRIGADIPGLAAAYALQKASLWPVAGGLVRFVLALWTLPHQQQRQRALESRAVQAAEQADVRAEDVVQVHRALRELETHGNQLAAYAATKSSSASLAAALDALAALDRSLAEVRAASEAKAGREELRESLAPLRAGLEALHASKAERSGLEEARQLMLRALETKAERQELTALSNYFIDLAQAKLARADLAPLLDSLGAIEQAQADLGRTLQEARAAAQAAIEDSGARSQQALRDALAPLASQAVRLERDVLAQAQRLSALARASGLSADESDDHRLDALYAVFEDRFRGSRDEIRRRQSIYLPHVRAAKAGSARARVIDLGCGRGEWLELLRDEGLTAAGVDLNRVFLESCRALKLDVHEQDALNFLGAQKPDSAGAITSFHMIEHLPHRMLIELFDQTLRVLRPGGVAIFETPNPENLLVGAHTFYDDPTHRNPLPPEPTRFILEARGFTGTEIVRLHPHADLGDGKNTLPRIAGLFSAEQDYTLIARKPL